MLGRALTGSSVRRGMARSLLTHPATIAPAGSHWSGRGGNKTTEAFKVRVTWLILRTRGLQRVVNVVQLVDFGGIRP